MSHVRCHMSGVTCQVSHVTLFFLQSGGASPWRVCYQRDLPRLVFTEPNTAATVVPIAFAYCRASTSRILLIGFKLHRADTTREKLTLCRAITALVDQFCKQTLVYREPILVLPLSQDPQHTGQMTHINCILRSRAKKGSIISLISLFHFCQYCNYFQ